MGYEKSIEAMKIAENLMPGGVNSPVRAFKSVDTPAIFMDHAKGSRIYDIDGNEYILVFVMCMTRNPVQGFLHCCSFPFLRITSRLLRRPYRLFISVIKKIATFSA